MEILLSTLSFVIFIIMAAAVVGIIVYFVKKGQGQELQINFDLLFGVYLFLATFVAIIALGTGVMYTVRGGMAQYFGLDFSYRQQQVSAKMVYDPMLEDYKEEDVDYEFEKDIDKKDIIRGITLIVVSTPILFLHLYGVKVLEKQEKAMEFVKRIYLLIGLVVFAIVGIITLPIGIYETLQYFLTEQATDVWAKTIPGEALATAIAFVPIWIYYLISYLNLTNKSSKK